MVISEFSATKAFKCALDQIIRISDKDLSNNYNGHLIISILHVGAFSPAHSDDTCECLFIHDEVQIPN